jgi:Tfp pilus assembly protein PilF
VEGPMVAPKLVRMVFSSMLVCALTAGAARADELALRKAYELWEQGYALHLLGHYEKATELFAASIAIQPTADAHTFRGWSLSMLGRLKEAIDDCKQAIRLDPDYGNPYNDIGVYLIELDQWEEAIPWLKKAMAAKRYCCYQYPHFNLGRIRLMQGRMAEAKRSFEQALFYDAEYEPAVKALEFIREHWREPI